MLGLRTTTLTLLALVIGFPTPDAEGEPAAARISTRGPVLVSGDRPGQAHVEPSLAAHPSDPLRLVGAAVIVLEAELDRAAFGSAAFVSADGGATWRRQALSGCGVDPWVAFGPDGEVYVACHDLRSDGDEERTGVLVHRSPDGGDTWLEPVQVPMAPGRSVDQPKITVDRGDGERRGTVYVAVGEWMPAPGLDGFLFGTVVARSSDRGRTFSASDKIIA